MKRWIRVLKLAREQAEQCCQSMDREKRKLEARGSRFDARKIEVLAQAMEIQRDVRKEINRKISAQGGWLVMFCRDADQILSGHDKAQVLGISHLRLERILEEVRSVMSEDEGTVGLFALIHACQAEHRCEHMDIPEQAPLWEAAHLSMLHLLETREDLRETMSEAAGRLLAELGIPMYRRTVDADGEEHMKRVPPVLRVVR